MDSGFRMRWVGRMTMLVSSSFVNLMFLLVCDDVLDFIVVVL